MILTQLFATLVMVGIIWFVQLVHYPLYALVGDARFSEYLKRHLAVTPRIVGPAILLECVTAVWLACVKWDATPVGAVGRTVSFVGLALLVGTLIVTIAWTERAQKKLLNGFDAATHRSFLLSNWIRTAGWSARGAIALWMAWAMLR